MITMSSGGTVPRIWTSLVKSKNVHRFSKTFVSRGTFEGLADYIDNSYGFIIGPWELTKWEE